jgi:hypothetical protein
MLRYVDVACADATDVASVAHMLAALRFASQVSHTAIVPQYVATSLELVSALL